MKLLYETPLVQLACFESIGTDEVPPSSSNFTVHDPLHPIYIQNHLRSDSFTYIPVWCMVDWEM